MKKIVLAISAFLLILSSCKSNTSDSTTEYIQTTFQATVCETEAAVPITVSPLATEDFLLPLDDFSWERAFSAEYIMLHFTSAIKLSQTDPYNMDTVRNIFKDSEVSIHYIIDRNGNISCFIPEDRAAWHAGKGEYANDERLTNAMNKYSIGIELLAIGSQKDMEQYLTQEEYNSLDSSVIGFTEEQYSALSTLLNDICERNQIAFDKEHIIGHDMYNPQKSDPGELFDWSKIGL